MERPSDDLTVATAFDRDTVRPLVRTSLLLVGGLFLLGLASLLPGLGRLFAGFPVSVGTFVRAIATTLVVGALATTAPTVETLVRRGLSGPPTVVEDAARSSRDLVAFAAIVVAYRGLASAIEPAFDVLGAAWLYHAVFLVAALVPVVLVARRLSRSLDPVADLLTTELVAANDERTTDDRTTGDRTATDAER